MHLVPKKFIVKGDLSATLKSIRAANKHSIIRYVDSPRTSSIKSYYPSNIETNLDQATIDHSSRVRTQQNLTSK